MCGIAGVFRPGASLDEGELEAMNTCLTHRGPDDAGIYLDGAVGLAHRRLSIIDPETGQQPIFNESETVSVVFNGEIYNYRELRTSLIEKGHTFATSTDTEVLVHLYEERGLSFVKQLEGMFTFALWDSTDQRLLLARDPIGIKPLVVANDGKSIAFASELSALLEADVDHGGLDETAIAQYFSLGYIPTPRTAFANFEKLKPGVLRIVTEDEVRDRTFYNPSVEPRNVSFENAVDGLRTRVEDAVQKRLMSDVPLGAFLSGGIDSSIIVGTMARQTDEPLKTFTIGFEESLFDESWAANEVAEYHGTTHTECTVTPKEVRSAIPEVLGRLGEPFADQSIIPTYIVASETSRDVKVALSGDGADELFGGYNRYRGEYYSRYYRTIPEVARKSIIEPTVARLNASRESSRGERTRKIRKFLRGGETDTAKRHFEWARIADDKALSSVNNDPIDEGQSVFRERHESVERYLSQEQHGPLSRIQAVDTRFGLPDQILHKTDQAGMYNSLEVRVPFLDTEVVEYAMSLPTNYKITPRKQKRVLKCAFDDVLPDSILKREKQGFDMPIGEWFKNELETEFKETLAALDSDLVDIPCVKSCFEEHKEGKHEYGKFLWAVYVFARWYNRMDKEEVI